MSLAETTDDDRDALESAADRIARFHRQRRVLWITVFVAVVAYVTCLMPSWANWTLPVAIPLAWALAFSLWPNPVKYATVLLVAGSILVAIAAPSLERARDQARINTASDHMLDTGTALQHLMFDQSGDRAGNRSSVTLPSDKGSLQP